MNYITPVRRFVDLNDQEVRRVFAAFRSADHRLSFGDRPQADSRIRNQHANIDAYLSGSDRLFTIRERLGPCFEHRNFPGRHERIQRPCHLCERCFICEPGERDKPCDARDGIKGHCFSEPYCHADSEHRGEED